MQMQQKGGKQNKVLYQGNIYIYLLFIIVKGIIILLKVIVNVQLILMRKRF